MIALPFAFYIMWYSFFFTFINSQYFYVGIYSLDDTLFHLIFSVLDGWWNLSRKSRTSHHIAFICSNQFKNKLCKIPINLHLWYLVAISRDSLPQSCACVWQLTVLRNTSFFASGLVALLPHWVPLSPLSWLLSLYLISRALYNLYPSFESSYLLNIDCFLVWFQLMP